MLKSITRRRAKRYGVVSRRSVSEDGLARLSFKALSLLFLLTITYAHGMKHAITKQEHSHNSASTVLYEEKDPRLLLKLPDEILGIIVKYANPDKYKYERKHVLKSDLFNAIKQLIQLSWVCKNFERLNKPDTIKATLNLDQKKLDFSLLKYGNLDVTPFFELLVTMGANISTHYRSIMQCLTFSSNRYLIERFLQLNPHVDINQRDKRGETPLRHAIDLDKPNIVRVLVERNADMYLTNEDGETPANAALTQDKTECLKVLIENGLNTTIKYDIYGVGQLVTIAEWAKLRITWKEKNADKYYEIYNLVTGKKYQKTWYEKSSSELLTDTCIIS